LAYFVAYLGGALAAGRHPLLVALAVGACALLAYALACAYVFKFGDDRALARRLMPWLMLGAYALITGALVTVGRVGFGVAHATTTRYVAFSLYLLVALVYLLPCIVEDAARRRYLTAGRLALLERFGALTAALLVLAHVVIFALVVRHSAADWRRMMLRGKACVLFLEVVPGERCQPEGRFSDLGLMRERAESLDRMGYLRPPLVKQDRMRDLAAGESCAEGSLKLLPAQDGAVIAEGTARLPRRGGEPADAVVLAYGRTLADQTLFALAVTGARDDPSWHKTLPPGALPTGPGVEVTAWAFDAEEGKAYRLCGNRAADSTRP
jgi:hypothetical protein